ncbi:MAG TPA: glycosyltransferase family 87 protein [Anaerolineae bacterium]|nr:glycosyltransferase family 87 protein [Anaerolineae bacterium]
MTRLNAALAQRATGAILFIACLLLWAALTKVHTHSWQEESRMATVQALVEQGTFAIDHTEFNRTGDKVLVNDHFYSDKTPLLSVAAAGVYAILHNGFGLTLDPTICVPDADPSACRAFGPAGLRLTAFYWLTLIFVGAASALLIALFWKALLMRGLSGSAATGLALALGLASPIAPYSIVFAGHVPAALSLFAGFWLLTLAPSRPRFFWAGLLISLAANIDLTLAVFLVAFGVYVFASQRRGVVPFALGALLPFGASAIINYAAAGTLAPLYFDPKAYDFFGTVLNKTVGGTAGFYSLDFGLRYAYDLLVGRRGLFSFTPLLVFAVAGLWRALRNRCAALRPLAVAALAGSLAFTLYLILRTDNFGGTAWGTRWFVPLIPLGWYFVACWFEPRRGVWWKLALVAAIGLSFLTAVSGLHDAWRDVPPIIRL